MNKKIYNISLFYGLAVVVAKDKKEACELIKLYNSKPEDDDISECTEWKVEGPSRIIAVYRE